MNRILQHTTRGIVSSSFTQIKKDLSGNFTKLTDAANNAQNNFKQRLNDALVISKAIKDPSKTLNSLNSVVSGIVNVAEGRFTLGGYQIFSGGFGFYSIFRTRNTAPLVKLIQSTQEDIKSAQELNEKNKKSSKVIGQCIENVDKSVKELNKRLNDIQGISNNGSKEVEEAKNNAGIAIANAKIKYQEAENTFKDIAKILGGIEELSSESIRLIKKAQASNLKGAELVEYFMKKGVKIAKTNVDINKGTALAMKKLSEGLALLDEANALFTEAQSEQAKAIALSKAKLDEIKKVAQVKQDCQKDIEAIKKENENIKKNSKVLGDFLSNAQVKLEEAEAKAAEKFGYGTLFCGLATTAVTSALLNGPLSITAGAAVSKAVHGRDIKSPVAYYLNYAFARVGLVNKLADKNYEDAEYKNGVKFQFKTASTSAFSAFLGSSSKTEGKLSVKIGEEVIECAVDLNNDIEVISSSDAKKIAETLLLKIDFRASARGTEPAKGKITVAEAGKILDELKGREIKRHCGIQKGFLKGHEKTHFALLGEDIIKFLANEEMILEAEKLQAARKN